MILTTNGNHRLNERGHRHTSTYYVSGALGAATASFTYENEAGTFVPLIDADVAIGSQYVIEHGSGMQVYLTVANADGSTNIIVERVHHD